jgi:hypothetical protein
MASAAVAYASAMASVGPTTVTDRRPFDGMPVRGLMTWSPRS